MLQYIANEPMVQSIFLLVVLFGYVATMINLRTKAANEMSHEENQEARRERLIMVEHKKPEPSKKVTIENRD